MKREYYRSAWVNRNCSGWYSAEDYRDVKLSVTDKVHLAVWDNDYGPQLKNRKTKADSEKEPKKVNQDDQAQLSSIYGRNKNLKSIKWPG